MAALLLTHGIWLAWLGNFLVKAEPPDKADAIIVLAGDVTGSRILTAADLVRKHYAPVVLVSGPFEIYGHNEAFLAIDYAVSKGCPKDWFRPVTHRSNSTRDEARALASVLRREHYSKVLLVTSDFHTRRAGSIFRRSIPGLNMLVVAAPAPDFHPDSWWTSRPSQKVFLQEWAKTLADWLNI